MNTHTTVSQRESVCLNPHKLQFKLIPFATPNWKGSVVQLGCLDLKMIEHLQENQLCLWVLCPFCTSSSCLEKASMFMHYNLRFRFKRKLFTIDFKIGLSGVGAIHSMPKLSSTHPHFRKKISSSGGTMRHVILDNFSMQTHYK